MSSSDLVGALTSSTSAPPPSTPASTPVVLPLPEEVVLLPDDVADHETATDPPQAG